MPFKSKAQRRLFYAKMDKGEISPETVKHWEEATPKDKKLPEHVTKKAEEVPGEPFYPDIALALYPSLTPFEIQTRVEARNAAQFRNKYKDEFYRAMGEEKKAFYLGFERKASKHHSG